MVNYKIIREDNSAGAKIMFFRDNTFDQYLEVSFGNDLDLYFALVGLEESNTFLIDKDNYDIYKIFDNLYKEVLNGCFFKITEEEINSLKRDSEMYKTDFAEELAKLKKRREATRREHLRMASYKGLIKDDKITWLSDDYPDDSAPYLIIHKFPNAYELEFGVLNADRELEVYEKMALLDFRYKFMVSVRFCNSRSRYEPFNTCFMQAYNKMLALELDPDYHQDNTEESMVDQKLEKSMSIERALKKQKRNLI